MFLILDAFSMESFESCANVQIQVTSVKIKYFVFAFYVLRFQYDLVIPYMIYLKRGNPVVCMPPMPMNLLLPRALLVIALFLAVPLANAANSTHPQPPHDQLELGLPLECRLGETCWVANYVDVEPANTARDFRCHARTYEGHDGTDFAIQDLSVMAAGVPVLASAPGVVRSARDGMADVALTDAPSRERIAGRECGNGVVLDHENGWQTQYCHVRRGTVRVKKGERVERGQELGLVGLSGQTEFPHVHMTVRHQCQAIDPFTGQSSLAGCGNTGPSMWRGEQPSRMNPSRFIMRAWPAALHRSTLLAQEQSRASPAARHQPPWSSGWISSAWKPVIGYTSTSRDRMVWWCLIT